MSDVAEVQKSKAKESAAKESAAKGSETKGSEVEVSGEATPKIVPWEQLRLAREKLNLTPADIAKELKLDIRFVKALEAGQLDKLPQPVYTAGYIRAYAKLVGLPPDDIVGDYASQESTSMPEIVQTREKIPARYRHVDNVLPKSFSVSHGGQEDKKLIRLFIIGLVVAVVLAIAWQVYTNMQAPEAELAVGAMDDSTAPNSEGSGGEQMLQPGGETPEQTTIKLAIPGQSTSATDATASSTTGDNKSITSGLQGDAQKLVTISLHYTEDSWIDVRD
ncbi:helix-turn-helix domain-containing protein, partial [Kaarinaea lacus]